MRSFIEFAVQSERKCEDKDLWSTARASKFMPRDGFSTIRVNLLVSVWPASGTYPHDAPVDNRPCPQSTRPGTDTRGGPHGRNRLRKHRIPLLALPTAGARPLPAPTQSRRRLASSIPSPFRIRRPQDASHHSSINTKQPAFRDKTDHPMEQRLYREGFHRHRYGL